MPENARPMVLSRCWRMLSQLVLGSLLAAIVVCGLPATAEAQLIHVDGFESGGTFKWTWWEGVLYDEELVIELWWNTPGDPDQYDQGPTAGADLDLHFRRGSADWFDPVDDCYWFNLNPNWGDAGSTLDDPLMKIDDTDGWGPEIIVVEQLEPSQTFRVGAYYFDDHGFGASSGTARLYFQGTLIATLDSSEIPATDSFWELWDIDHFDDAVTVTTLNTVTTSPP